MPGRLIPPTVGKSAHLSMVPLVSLTLIGFVLVIIFIVYSYSQFMHAVEEVLLESELESKKMHLNSELMELARSRTRITSKIMDVHDPFEQDELNVELENHAGRFAALRQQLLKLPLTDEEQRLINLNDSIVPTILPVQRAVVEMAMNQDPSDDERGQKLLYEVVLPGQGEMIKNLAKLIAIEQEHIAKLTGSSLDNFQRQRERNYRFIVVVLSVAVILAITIVLRIRRIQHALYASRVELEQANVNLENKVEQRTNELHELNKRLQQASEHDELTGLFNRRKFNTYIEYEVSRTQRENSCFAVIMADIDYFKPYNDNYGHQKGDEVIRTVGRKIQDCLTRSIDFVARYGGEEFVIVLPNTDLDGGASVAHSIRQAVLELAIPHEFSEIASHVTMSFGVAEFDAQGAPTVIDTIELADQRLYLAKKGGRNRVVGGDTPPAETVRCKTSA